MQLLVWNQHSTCPVLKYSEHTAAVKAIAWSPHSYSVLASGGGTADRCIRLWNTCKNSRLNCVDTGSQVLIFKHQTRFLIIWNQHLSNVNQSIRYAILVGQRTSTKLWAPMATPKTRLSCGDIQACQRYVVFSVTTENSLLTGSNETIFFVWDSLQP